MSKLSKNLIPGVSCLKSNATVGFDDDVIIVELSYAELDFEDTLGRKPNDDPDRTERKVPKGPDDPLEILISEAHAMVKAKFLALDLIKGNDQSFDKIEDSVKPMWPCVWWDDCAIYSTHMT